MSLPQGFRSRYSSSQNPCPVCGKDHGCAFASNGAVLCFRTRSPQDTPRGWRFVKLLSNDMGGLVVPVDGGATEYIPRSKPVAPAGFTDAELDRQFRALYPQLPLHGRHRAKLEHRGFSTDQVTYLESIGFRSWVGRKKVVGINPRLPGIKGDRLNSATGYGIPAYTPDQRLIGYQIAPDNPGKAKYRYLPGTIDARAGGVLLFTAYGLPEYRDRPRSTPEATLYFAGTVTPGTDPDGNPLSTGKAGVAAVLTDPTGTTIATAAKAFAKQTEAQAAYNGLLLGLQVALEHGVTALTIAGSNHPIVYQVAHSTPIEEPGLIPLNHLCRRLLEQQRIYQLKRILPGQNLALALATQVNDGIIEQSDRYFDLRTVWLVDGALKTYTTAYRHHATVIGCPGGLHGANEPDLGRYLALLGAERVVLMPDAGDVVNPHTARSNRATITALQTLGYSVRVGWWGQRNKPVKPGDPGDIDEVPTGTRIEFLTVDQFEKKHPVEVLRRIDQILSPGLQKFDRPVPYPRAVEYRQPTRFKPGSALATLQQLIADKERFSFNKTYTGGGKSYTISQFKPADFGASQLLWVVDDPVTLEYPEWSQYRGRDAGRVVRSDGRVIRANGDEPDKFRPANCEKSTLSDYLLRKGIVPDVSGVCVTCPLYEDKSCSQTEGRYLHDKAVALKSSRLRLPAAALGSEILRDSAGKNWEESKAIARDKAGTTTEDTRKPGAVIFVDDVDPWVSSYSLSLDTIKATAGELLADLPMAVIDAIRRLQQLLAEKTGRRWVNRSHTQLMELLPAINLAKEALQPAYIREEMAVREEGSKISRIWLQDFIEVLQGAKGYLYSYKGDLYINRVNARFIEAITHPAVIHTQFLDATARVEHLQQWLRDWVTTPIPVIAQDEPEKPGVINLVQVTGLGDLGYNRSTAQKAELAELKQVLTESYPEFAEVDIKGTLDKEALDEAVRSLSLRWRSTSRGSNAAKDRAGLICYGTPRMNLSAAIARFCLMTGSPDVDQDAKAWTAYPMDWRNKREYWGRVLAETQDAGFAEFYHQLTLAEIHQAYGRLRAAIRPGEIVQVLHITDYPLGLPATTWTASELMPNTTPVSPVSNPVTLDDITTAIEALHLLEKPLTQVATAEYLGVPLSSIVHAIERQPYSWDDIRAAVTNPQPETLEKPGSSATSTPYIYMSVFALEVAQDPSKSMVSAVDNPVTPPSTPAPAPTALPDPPRKYAAATVKPRVTGTTLGKGGKEM